MEPNQEEKADPEVVEDDEFYQQLLKERVLGLLLLFISSFKLQIVLLLIAWKFSLSSELSLCRVAGFGEHIYRMRSTFGHLLCFIAVWTSLSCSEENSREACFPQPAPALTHGNMGICHDPWVQIFFVLF
ncbi:hypothetical protein F2Q70_00034858 [Brassica cretica]|uniref:Uncharacterized protein n=2 Tax=Brassica cretica TaxID=69181 RepID=A0A3N6QG22_BRACR|nr:hypothetical protein F2Q68_00029758 [Brassica cretica]KAF2584684.1 hypothetical protein F2Q70_00034858 [Brassica cretica]KAF3529467.1 hypothetical protein DY000_02037855 [Brassica cretica]